MRLFKIDRATPILNKTASLSINLSSQPEQWDQEILDLAYKLHPWLADFLPTVEFVKKIDDRQYGVGSIAVRMNRPLDPGLTGYAQAFISPAPQQQQVLAHIPIVIKEGTLSPMDIFIAGSDVYPLEEDIFRKKSTQFLDSNATTGARSDPTLIGQLWPPGRSVFGGPFAELGLNVMGKMGSDEPSENFHFFRNLEKLGAAEVSQLREGEGYPLLTKIVSGELRTDMNKVAQLGGVIGGSSTLRPALGEVLSSLTASIPPARPMKGSVVQVLGGDSGYSMRSTDPSSFSFDCSTPVTLEGLTGNDPTIYSACAATAKVKTNKSISYSFDYPALCAATLQDGQSTRKGTLFSTVIDLDGQPIGKSLFADSKGNWCLESVLYAEVGRIFKEVAGEAFGQGTGVFVCEGAGGIVCTVPITVLEVRKERQGTCYKCVVHGSRLANSGMPLDTSVKLYLAEGVAVPAFSTNTGTLLMPASYKWFTLGQGKFRPSTPLQVDRGVVYIKKTASDEYSVEGTPVSPVVHGPLNYDDTAFVLAATGVAPGQIDEVMKLAEAGVTLTDCVTLSERQELPNLLPKEVDTELLKAAAAISDPNTVDAVLTLNMMDAETEDNFMTLAENLEDAQQKVAKLLLLSRLGISSIPEGAAKVVMTRMSPIIDSLKILAMQNIYAN